MRAAVMRTNPIRDSVEVVIWVPSSHGFPTTAVVELGTDGAQMYQVEPMDEPPTIVIPDEVARALLDALAAHYGGTGDYRQLRRDFEHERGRVDRLITSLIGAQS